MTVTSWKTPTAFESYCPYCQGRLGVTVTKPTRKRTWFNSLTILSVFCTHTAFHTWPLQECGLWQELPLLFLFLLHASPCLHSLG